MKFIKFAITALSYFLVINVQAGAVLVDNAQVISVQSYTGGTVGIITDKQTLGPVPCSSKKKFIIPSTENGVGNTLSVLLTAKVLGNSVDIYVDDSNCSSGYPLIKSVIIL